MDRLDYQKLESAGYSPSQINQIIEIAKQRGVEVVNQPLVQTPEAKSMILDKQYPVTQEYGNYNPSLYSGINQSMTNPGADFGTPVGTPINLPQGRWKVAEVGTGWNTGWGNSLVFEDMTTGEKLRFSHLNKMLRVNPGDVLDGGKQIAETGATGNVTGPHVDISYYNNQGQLGDVLRSKYRDSLGY